MLSPSSLSLKSCLPWIKVQGWLLCTLETLVIRLLSPEWAHLGLFLFWLHLQVPWPVFLFYFLLYLLFQTTSLALEVSRHICLLLSRWTVINWCDQLAYERHRFLRPWLQIPTPPLAVDSRQVTTSLSYNSLTSKSAITVCTWSFWKVPKEAHSLVSPSLT